MSADIIAKFPTRFGKLLKLRHNGRIAADARNIFPKAVVDLGPSVEAHDDIVLLAVAKVDHLIVHQHAVCRQRKAELFVMLLFFTAAVGDKLFADFPIHKGLTAKEINLKVCSVPRICDEKVECLFSNFKGHQCPFALILSLTGKAVIAV